MPGCVYRMSDIGETLSIAYDRIINNNSKQHKSNITCRQELIWIRTTIVHKQQFMN